jgi:hypothetical protein
MMQFHTVAPRKEEIDVARIKLERTSQQLRAIKATELASNLRAIITGGHIDARCAIDSDTVNVFRNREALVITSEANDLYLLRHQTTSGNSVLGGRISGNNMSKENMMQVVTEWMAR